jgi:hypothetical protein
MKSTRGHLKTMRSGLLALMIAAACGLAATAGPAQATASHAFADAAFADGADFTPMSDSDLAHQRGGFDGVAFGIFLSGTLNQPTTSVLPAGMTVTSLSPSQVQIVGGVGNLAGANGIFQFTSIVGDMNVVNNNIIVNVAVQPASPVNSVTFIP